VLLHKFEKSWTNPRRSDSAARPAASAAANASVTTDATATAGAAIQLLLLPLSLLLPPLPLPLPLLPQAVLLLLLSAYPVVVEVCCVRAPGALGSLPGRAQCGAAQHYLQPCDNTAARAAAGSTTSTAWDGASMSLKEEGWLLVVSLLEHGNSSNHHLHSHTDFTQP
jgi:hypothetical protein